MLLLKCYNAAKSGCLDWVIVGSCFEKELPVKKKFSIVKKKKKLHFTTMHLANAFLVTQFKNSKKIRC